MRMSCSCLFAIHNARRLRGCIANESPSENERVRTRGNLYVSHTKVTYGTERNISVCRCTVKRGMLSCFPFMICQQKAAASTAEVYISRPVHTKESKQKTSVLFFQPEGGKTRRTNLKSIQMAVSWGEMQ